MSISINSSLLFITLLGGICCFIPLYFDRQKDSLDSEEIRSHISSQGNRDLAIATVALSVPIFLGIAADKITGIFQEEKSHKVSTHIMKALLTASERSLLIWGALICTATAFLPPDMPHLVNYYSCACRCRSVYFNGALALSLYRLDEGCWSLRTSILTVILSILSNNLAAFIDITEVFAGVEGLRNFTTVLFFTAIALIFIGSLKWLLSISKKFFRRHNNISGGCNDDISRHRRGSGHSVVFPLLYVAVTVFIIITLSLLRRLFPNGVSKTFLSSLSYSVITTLYPFLVNSISERMMKHEVIKGLVSDAIFVFLIEVSGP